MVTIRDRGLTLLWGHLKSFVYKTCLKSLDELKQRIIIECANISPADIRGVAISPKTNKKLKGEQFEHYLT